MALDEARGSRVSGSTSDGICLMRAVAAQEPDPELRCPDSLARTFVGDLPLARLCDSKPGFRLARWITERRIPGAYWSEVARVKYFDELLLSEVARGVSQVVILGAGLDSRAYRFKDELANVSVFEVDHPVTSARKLDRVRAALGKVPDRVTYVQTDLTTIWLVVWRSTGSMKPRRSSCCGAASRCISTRKRSMTFWGGLRPALRQFDRL